MKAKDVMSTPVVAVRPDALLRDIVQLMLERHISGVPVMEDERVIGVVNEGDLLRRFEIGTDTSAAESSWWEQLVHRDRLPLDYIRSHARMAGDLMTTPVVTVDEDTPIQEIASIFAARHIRRIPVTADGRVRGIVTRADLVRAIAARTRDEDDDDEERSDEAIRTQLLAELERQHWWHPVSSTFDVHGGIVHFHGLIGGQSDRRAARVAAENVPGVRGVEDHRVMASGFQPMF